MTRGSTGGKHAGIGAARMSGVVLALLVGVPVASAQEDPTSLTTKARFTDHNGTVLPLGGVFNEYLEKDTTGDGDGTTDLLGTETTNKHGISQVIPSQTQVDEEKDGALEFFGHLSAEGDWGKVRAGGNNPMLGAYSFKWPSVGSVTVPVGTDKIVTLPSPGNVSTTGRAFSISQPIDFMHTYYGNAGKFGAVKRPFVQVRYDPVNGDNSSAFYFPKDWPGDPNPMGVDFININDKSWSSWDVIMHEYGHHLMWHNGMMAGVGGDHAFGTDNIPALGAKTGSQLAWNEGSATTLGLLAVVDGKIGDRFTLDGKGLAKEDTDARYHDNGQGFWVDWETMDASWGMDRGEGEGDELSVGRALWDLYDDTPGDAFAGGGKDTVSLGADGLWNAMKGNKTFGEAWSDISKGKTPKERAEFGEILTANNIAHAPKKVGGGPGPSDPGIIIDTTPELSWEIQNNGNSDFYQVLVFEGIGDVISLEPVWDSEPREDGADMIEVAIELALGDYSWMVLNSPAWTEGPGFDLTDPVSWYWSRAETFTLIPTPGGLVLLGLGVVAAIRRRARTA